MTSAKDQRDSVHDEEAVAALQKTEEYPELDTEIVRDLELDEQEGDVRGGACPTSKPV